MSKDDDSRTLVLCGDVCDKTVAPIINRIYDINEEDRIKEAVLRAPQQTPIKLIVNTFGGGAHAALALIGAMEMSQTPIHTYAIGKAMSAGLWITVAGDMRFAHRFTTFMYHEAADWNIGKFQEQREQLEESERLMELMDNFLVERTKVEREKLDAYKENRTDWYFSAEEALEHGVVDYMLTPVLDDDEDEEEEPKPIKKPRAKKKK